MLNKRGTDLVAYLGWPGLAIAYFLGDRQASRFHLNQALLLHLIGFAVKLIAGLPLIGWVIALAGGLFCIACWLIGLINALQGVEQPLPGLGRAQLL